MIYHEDLDAYMKQINEEHWSAQQVPSRPSKAQYWHARYQRVNPHINLFVNIDLTFVNLEIPFMFTIAPQCKGKVFNYMQTLNYYVRFVRLALNPYGTISLLANVPCATANYETFYDTVEAMRMTYLNHYYEIEVLSQQYAIAEIVESLDTQTQSVRILQEAIIESEAQE